MMKTLFWKIAVLLVIIFPVVFTAAETKSRRPTRVACIGDSITAGSGIPDRAEHYPERLGVLLGDQWEVKNFGIGGACVRKKGSRPYLTWPLLKEALAYEPDVVVIMLGVNDSSALDGTTITEFEADYKELIECFKPISSKPRIFLCLPTPYGSDSVLAMMHATIRRLVKTTADGLIDLYTPLRGKPEFFPDYCHPNAAGAAVMAQEVFQALTAPSP